jgi:hypothetical protein
MAVDTTKTDAGADRSSDDEAIRLREWGTNRVYALPSSPGDECLIGTSAECSLRLDDERVSRRHAQLRREGGQWWVRDLDSKNGVRQDGARRREPFILEPGAELGLGGVVLIAESGRSIALRSFCARVVGWGSNRIAVVDGVLRSIRLAARLRAPLPLCGASDLVPIAHSLHRYAVGADRPFVVCDPRRRTGEESVRSAANYEIGLVAAEAAAGGWLCVRSKRLPHDFSAVLERIREPDARVQLIMCSERHDETNAAIVPIEVPPLATRTGEVARIVDEYVLDATTALNTPPGCLTRSDRQWILEQAATTLPEIEKAALRLVALRTSPTMAHAAARLGMAPISLSRWIDRRRPPSRGRPGCDD